MVTIPTPVTEWLAANGFGAVIRSQPVGGGCINNGSRLETDLGHTFFLKQNNNAPPDMFQREADGLRALAVSGGPRTPVPLLIGTSYLLLEDLSPVAPAAEYWRHFGQQVATVHNQRADQFGFDEDNYLGSTPQPNPWLEDGYEFFRLHRLLFQAEMAQAAGRLSRQDLQRVELICRRLPQLIPSQPASLLHGDLWSGNAIAGSDGQPAWIDPAAHYGWAEAELGMTTLFGGFPSAFYDAYQQVHPLDAGWRERLPIYNLYHLLNHLNLFGQSYLPQVQSVLSRFAD
ncbi:MAG: fructosamine kinase family protein [Anaerolineales bacterium]